MNLTLHMVRNDFRRMRGWIGCWIGVLLLPIATGAMLLARNPLSETNWRLPNTLAILAGLQVVVGYILTIILIHEHGIVGTRQFWLTRPISRGRLLRAKTIGVVVVIGLLPVAVSLPWWLWCGFGVGQIANAAAETFLVMMLVVVPAALMAVLTDSFPRALLWTLVLVAVVLFAMLYFSIVNSQVVRTSGDMSLAVARSVVAIGTVVLEMGAVVVVQFFARRRGWWLGLAVGLMVISIVASMRWPWPWVSGIPPERNVARAAGVTVRFDGAERLPPRTEQIPDTETFQWVGTRFLASGIPEGLALGAIDAFQTWRWENGIRIQRSDNFYGRTDLLGALGLRWITGDPETRRWLAENDEKFKLRLARERPLSELAVEGSAWIQPSMVARMQTEPPKYEAHIFFSLWRPEIRFEIPLAPSRWVTRHNYGLRIEGVDGDASRTFVVLVETQPVLIRMILREWASAPMWLDSMAISRDPLLAINRDRKEIKIFDEWHTARAAVVNGVVIQWRSVSTSAPRVIRAGKWVTQSDWMEGATLGILGGSEEAIFTRDVKVERFELMK
jgi:hypothetical protein